MTKHPRRLLLLTLFFAVFMKGSFCAIIALLLFLSAHLIYTYTTKSPVSRQGRDKLGSKVVSEAKDAEFELLN